MTEVGDDRLARLHPGRAAGCEDWCARGPAVQEVGPGEAEEAPGVHREHRAGRDVRPGQGPDRGRVVAGSRLGLDVADGGAEQDRLVRARRRVVDPERREQVLAQAHVVRLPAEHLDEPAEDHEAGVVVGPQLARREQLGYVVQHAQELLHAVVAHAGVGEEVALEARSVGQQLPHRDLLGRRLVGQVEVGQVAADRLLQLDPALVDQLHHQRARPELGDRADLEDGVRRRVDPRRLAQHTGGVDRDVVLDHHPHRGRGYVVPLHQGGEVLLDPVRHVLQGGHAGQRGTTARGPRRSEQPDSSLAR